MSRPVFCRFQLYVASGTQNSSLALANLTALCQANLAGRHEIEIVDVLQEPGRALANGIFMTPTLVKLTPAPVKKIVGTLSQLPTVLQALELESIAA